MIPGPPRPLPSGELDALRLAVLGDALEVAGCDNADILNHLRSPGPHVRGCWPIDLLTGGPLREAGRGGPGISPARSDGSKQSFFATVLRAVVHDKTTRQPLRRESFGLASCLRILPMSPARFAFPTCLLLLLPGNRVQAAKGVDYTREVKPILAARCYACHGAPQQKAGLRLDTVALMKMGGDNGPAFVPGKWGESLLFRNVAAAGRKRMPPASEGEPLKKGEIALLKQWIDQGATGPADEKPETDPKDHWAFKAPVRPRVPLVKNRRVGLGNPIDHAP